MGLMDRDLTRVVRGDGRQSLTWFGVFFMAAVVFVSFFWGVLLTALYMSPC